MPSAVLADRRGQWLLLRSRTPRRAQRVGEENAVSLSSTLSSRVQTKLQKQNYVLHHIIADHNAVLRTVFPLPTCRRWGLEPRHIDPKLVRGGKEARLLHATLHS